MINSITVVKISQRLEVEVPVQFGRQFCLCKRFCIFVSFNCILTYFQFLSTVTVDFWKFVQPIIKYMQIIKFVWIFTNGINLLVFLYSLIFKIHLSNRYRLIKTTNDLQCSAVSYSYVLVYGNLQQEPDL